MSYRSFVIKPFVLLLLSLTLTSAAEVVVSIHPFYLIVKEIAGDRLGVTSLLPPSADYHTYEFKPGDLILLKRAKAVLITGIPVGSWEIRLEELGGIRTYRLVGESLRDPHIWMSPRRMIPIARRVAGILIKIAPEGKEEFRKNLEDLLSRLRVLDKEFAKTLKSCKLRYLPEVHPSLHYLAEDYELDHIPITAGGHHGDLLPGEVLRFVRSVKEKGIDYFFAPEGYRGGLVKLLEERGLRKFTLNVKLEGEDYVSLMRENLKVIGEALVCR